VKIISIDPGGTTGWCIFEIEREGMEFKVSEDIKEHFVSSGQLNKPNHHSTLWRFLDKHQPDVIVCERYEKRNNDFSLLISVEYIGTVKTWAALNDRFVVFQGASQALHWMDEGAKLSRLGLTLLPYVKWKDANAALKHMVFYLVNTPSMTDVRIQILRTLRKAV